MIFDIKKFAIHDGPGIRTTIFFSRCPLNCRWCHNPECRPSSMASSRPSAAKHENSRLAESRRRNYQDIQDQITRFSGLTEDAIFELVLKEISKDIIFYDESGGGVTFSGGEPMMHPVMLMRLLESCKKLGIHTAVDTCGHADFDIFEKLYPLTDLFLYDLKLMDDDSHRKYTGVSNKIILDNLRKLAKMEANIRIRIPLIPGITDTEENLTTIADFITGLRTIKNIDLLPFNVFGKSKYRKLQRESMFSDLQTQSEEELLRISGVFP